MSSGVQAQVVRSAQQRRTPSYSNRCVLHYLLLAGTILWNTHNQASVHVHAFLYTPTGTYLEKIDNFHNKRQLYSKSQKATSLWIKSHLLFMARKELPGERLLRLEQERKLSLADSGSVQEGPWIIKSQKQRTLGSLDKVITTLENERELDLLQQFTPMRMAEERNKQLGLDDNDNQLSKAFNMVKENAYDVVDKLTEKKDMQNTPTSKLSKTKNSLLSNVPKSKITENGSNLSRQSEKLDMAPKPLQAIQNVLDQMTEAQQAQRRAFRQTSAAASNMFDTLKDTIYSTVDLIKQTPQTVNRVVSKSKEAIDYVQQTPVRTSQSIEKTRQTIDKASQTVTTVVEDVKAIPTTVQQNIQVTQQRIEATKQSITQTVTKVQELPATIEAKVTQSQKNLKQTKEVVAYKVETTVTEMQSFGKGIVDTGKKVADTTTNVVGVVGSTLGLISKEAADKKRLEDLQKEQQEKKSQMMQETKLQQELEDRVMAAVCSIAKAKEELFIEESLSKKSQQDELTNKIETATATILLQDKIVDINNNSTINAVNFLPIESRNENKYCDQKESEIESPVTVINDVQDSQNKILTKEMEIALNLAKSALDRSKKTNEKVDKK